MEVESNHEAESPSDNCKTNPREVCDKFSVRSLVRLITTQAPNDADQRHNSELLIATQSLGLHKDWVLSLMG